MAGNRCRGLGWCLLQYPAGVGGETYKAVHTRHAHPSIAHHAGNAPEVPLVSALRAVLTKSAAVIRLPYGATLTGGLFALAAAAAVPNHPVTKNISMVYWPGGDKSIENTLFMPDAFDGAALCQYTTVSYTRQRRI